MLNERIIEMLRDCRAETELNGMKSQELASFVFNWVFDTFILTEDEKSNMLENEQQYIEMLSEIK